MKKCNYCGYENIDSANFCINCGKEFASVDSMVNIQPTEQLVEEKESQNEYTSNPNFFQRLINTWQEVLLRPSQFFQKVSIEDSISFPLYFGVICTSVSIIAGLIWEIPFRGMELLSKNSGAITQFEGVGIVTILILCAVFSPVLALMMLIMTTAIYHTCAIIMKGKGSFDVTFRVICYSSAVDIMNFVPCIGPFFVMVYKIVVMAFGFKELHQMTMNRGILTTLLPVIFSVVIAVVIVMLVVMIVLLAKMF